MTEFLQTDSVRNYDKVLLLQLNRNNVVLLLTVMSKLIQNIIYIYIYIYCHVDGVTIDGVSIGDLIY
jgi:hypothetical protein